MFQKIFFPNPNDKKKVDVEFGLFSRHLSYDDDCREERWSLDSSLWWLVHGSKLPML